MHRRRRRFRTTIAACASALLLGSGLAVGASPTQAAPAPADSTAAEETFQQVPLAKGEAEVGEPMTLAVLPDRSVLHTSRDGTVRITDAGGTTRISGKLEVYSHDEEGLQGIGVDPDFSQNRFVYLYYAPPLDTPAGDAPSTGSAADFAPFEGVNRLSRFVLREDGTLDLSSEKKVLDVPASRGICCHVGGDIAFDGNGNLLLSTGDDTNPFASDGYTPIDERENRNPAYDAQRSSGNTNDLRGKILRIKVNADGSYSVPQGNLFEPGTPGTRPEIYAMGFRNPFRMTVDKPTGVVYVGDYGPDAGSADPQRGPGGQVEFNRVTGPGNYGWPYCHGDNDAYVDYDFATGASGEVFDCAAPKNESPHNTGLAQLPAAKPAWIPYDGNSVPEFGDGSESPMGGPVYRFDPELESGVKFPEAYDGDFFAGEFGRRWIKRIEHGEDGTVQSINDFPWSGTQVMDMEFGPDGALYVLDYGTAWFGGNEHSALYRIENATDGHAPIATASADRTSGQAPMTVAFSAEGSTDADGDELTYHWDFGDGGTAEGVAPRHVYKENGQYTATVTAKDPSGKTGTANVYVTVGNTAPTVELTLPGNGQLIEFGDAVPFKVEVTDPEDGRIDCSKVKVDYILGHDSHGHPVTSANGCEGTLQTTADGEHDPNANIFGVFNAEYTDQGGGGQPPLSAEDQNVVQPKHRQAEHHSDAHGVRTADNTAAEGGRVVGGIEDGDWISFEPYLLADANGFSARVSGPGSGGTIEIHAGSPRGRQLGSVTVPAGGDRDTFREVGTELRNTPESTTALYLVFRGDSGALYELDGFTLTTG